MAERFAVLKGETPSVVPEGMKLKLARNSVLAGKKAAALAEKKKLNKVKRHDLKMRASKYEKEYKAAENELVRMRRQAKTTGNFFVEPEAKMMMVIRITGINKLAPKPRKILKLLRLDQLNKATFVKCTQPVLNMIKCIEPYVILGYPNLKTVKELVLKKGYCKVQGQRIPIQDNETISNALGKYNIHGVDDLIHEIYTVGPNFKQANNFLWPFKLSSPNGGFVRKNNGFHMPKGGDWGNREELINGLVRRMM